MKDCFTFMELSRHCTPRTDGQLKDGVVIGDSVQETRTVTGQEHFLFVQNNTPMSIRKDIDRQTTR